MDDKKCNECRKEPEIMNKMMEAKDLLDYIKGKKYAVVAKYN